jgi:hypothetical protein
VVVVVVVMALKSLAFNVACKTEVNFVPSLTTTFGEGTVMMIGVGAVVDPLVTVIVGAVVVAPTVTGASVDPLVTVGAVVVAPTVTGAFVVLPPPERLVRVGVGVVLGTMDVVAGSFVVGRKVVVGTTGETGAATMDCDGDTTATVGIEGGSLVALDSLVSVAPPLESRNNNTVVTTTAAMTTIPTNNATARSVPVRRRRCRGYGTLEEEEEDDDGRWFGSPYSSLSGMGVPRFAPAVWWVIKCCMGDISIVTSSIVSAWAAAVDITRGSSSFKGVHDDDAWSSMVVVRVERTRMGDVGGRTEIRFVGSSYSKTVGSVSFILSSLLLL